MYPENQEVSAAEGDLSPVELRAPILRVNFLPRMPERFLTKSSRLSLEAHHYWVQSVCGTPQSWCAKPPASPR